MPSPGSALVTMTVFRFACICSSCSTAASRRYCSSDTELDPRIVGVFLLATPFWSGDGIWVWEEGKLERSAAERLSERVPVFLYHCEDDEVVPFSHLRRNGDFLRGATVKVLQTGGHQFGNDLAVVARDIRSVVEDATTSDPEPREPVH